MKLATNEETELSTFIPIKYNRTEGHLGSTRCYLFVNGDPKIVIGPHCNYI